jgi:hypothetical protein
MKLRFIYVASRELRKEVEFQVKNLGATLNWWFDRFEAQVASLNVGPGPALLLATHLDPGEVIWIYEVKDIQAAKDSLTAAGAKFQGELEIPNGPCARFDGPGDREIAIFEDRRPGAMEAAYQDRENSARVFL